MVASWAFFYFMYMSFFRINALVGKIDVIRHTVQQSGQSMYRQILNQKSEA
jgi:hypothetical protein